MRSADDQAVWKFYRPEPVPEVIYYYCSTDAFQGILESKKLWMSNAYSMNDFQEIRWIGRVIENVRDLMKANLAEDTSLRFREFVLIVRQLLESPIDPYLACFSSESDVLSQWRAYSHDGTGFCIGFNTAYFNIPKNLPLPNAEPAKTLGMHKVIYDDNAQVEMVSATLAAGFARAEELKQDEHKELIQIASHCAAHLQRMSLVFKNNAFFEEQEWRVMHVPIIWRQGSGQLSVKGTISPLKFRKSRNNIVPYFELDFSAEKSIPAIASVTQGPKNSVPEQFLKLLLASSGFGQAGVIRSRATYR